MSAQTQKFHDTLSSVFAVLVLLADWLCRYCHGITGPKKRRLSFRVLD
jgi:hypothetical protein